MQQHNTWQPFPVAALPKIIRDFVNEGAASIGCDPATIVLPLLAILASAIGNTRRLRLKNSWHVPPIVWTVVVGRSGSQKSPGYKFAMRPVETIRREMKQEHVRKLASLPTEDENGKKVMFAI